MIFLSVIEVFLKVVVAKFVSVLILTVLIGINLDGIISEVDELILCIS